MIKYEDSFFEGEWREGFFVESKMKRAWAAEMVVLEEIDRICKAHGIQYFADWGTLLGAVRHKGFIPWDDDIDIVMKRKDYNKFLQVVQEEIPSGWLMCNASLPGGDDWDHEFSRLINGLKIDFAKEHLDKFHGCPYIVGVDIFPLDNLPEDEEEVSVLYSLMKIAYGTIFFVKRNEMEIAEKQLDELEKMCQIKFDRGGNLSQQLFQLLDILNSSYSHIETPEMISYFSWYIQNKKVIFKKEWYSESIEVPFENMMIPIPIGYEQVLKVLYGEDYMVPIIGASAHEYPFYKKFDKVLEGLGIKNE